MPAVAGLLITACIAGTAAPVPSRIASSATASSTPGPTAAQSPSPLSLHAMSLALHSEPRYRLIFEGGDAGSFSQLRLVGVGGAIVATGDATPSSSEGIKVCSGTKTSQPPSYGALRVTLTLGSQEQLSDVIGHPERYGVEVFDRSWQPAPFIFECHAQE
jgi:hypothetical protein